MAVEHIKSTPVTNADATPRVANNPSVAGGHVRSVAGVCAAAASTSIGSTYRFCRVPSSARIHSVIFASGAAGATGQLNLGLYDIAENGGAVVDADFFASALDPGGGAIAPTDVTHESADAAANLITRGAQPLWQALGLSADPHKEYDVTGTISEAGADAFSMLCKAQHVN
jgi:hypothetical protein